MVEGGGGAHPPHPPPPPPPRDDLRLSYTTGTIHDWLSAATQISAVPLPKLI